MLFGKHTPSRVFLYRCVVGQNSYEMLLGRAEQRYCSRS